MDSIYNSRISFEARLINKVKIYKTNNHTGKLKPAKVSFVEIRTKDDADALKEASSMWGNDSEYSENIAHAAQIMINSEKGSYYNDSRVYALTSQKSNFDKLNSRAVLGMAEVHKVSDKQVTMSYVQVKPRIIYAFERDIHGVGTAMIKSLKGLYDKITLIAAPSQAVRNFYEKNGFKRLFIDKNTYVWEKSLKDWFFNIFS